MKQIKRADLHMHSTFSDGVEEPEERSKLLGWPDVIQNSMAAEQKTTESN